MEAEIRDKPSFANILVKLQPGEKIIAEADAMASMSSAIEMSTQWNGGVIKGILKSFFFGGEGLVCQFSGTGKVWVQTRHVQSFLSWANGFRPVQSNS